jgi:tetratricopeptide (TPR) repeat protein
MYKVKSIAPGLVLFMLAGFFTVYADQTDARLDKLFVTLQNSDNAEELLEAETNIWDIWFHSGEEEIDNIMERAGVAAQRGNLAYAERLYSEVIDKAPDFSEGWNRRATVRFYSQNFEGSLDDIERTLLLEPRHFGATWGLGMILGIQQDFSGAIVAFERLLKIKPNARDARARIEQLKKKLTESSV